MLYILNTLAVTSKLKNVRQVIEPIPFAQCLLGCTLRFIHGSRSRGRGNIQLRCMAESDDGTKPVVTFRLGVGSDKAPMVMMGMAGNGSKSYTTFSDIFGDSRPAR